MAADDERVELFELNELLNNMGNEHALYSHLRQIYYIVAGLRERVAELEAKAEIHDIQRRMDKLEAERG